MGFICCRFFRTDIAVGAAIHKPIKEHSEACFSTIEISGNREYRAGIHSQIREMKQNFFILKIKQAEYQKYKGLVDAIGRHTSNQEKLVRGIIPTGFRLQPR